MNFCLRIALAFTLACGGSPAGARLFDDDAIDELRPAAPVLVEEAEGAASSARDARARGNDAVAREWETLARLKLEAAEAKAARAELEARLATLRDEVSARSQRLAERIAAREALVAERRDTLVRRAALEEAARAFETAEGDERRRNRRRATALGGARLSAALALADRAELIAAAAVALGGAPLPSLSARLAQLRQQEGAVRSEPRGASEAEALANAQALHVEALQRLADARGEASPASCRTFIAMARERGLEAHLRDEGAVLVGSDRLPARIAVLRSMPGPIVVQGSLASRLRRRLGERVQRVGAADASPLVLLPRCTAPRP
ncbi:MAG: hypothetical protein AAF938_06830 [Myxococcota bacterium]